MSQAHRKCCCAPAPSNSVCAPDCCPNAKFAGAIPHAATHLFGFRLLANPLTVIALALVAPSRPVARPTAQALVGLHQRAAPRLPLRI
jgi:hypothetical protein